MRDAKVCVGVVENKGATLLRCDDFPIGCDVRRRWWGEIVAVFGVEGDAFDRSVTRSVITHAIADLQENKNTET